MGDRDSSGGCIADVADLYLGRISLNAELLAHAGIEGGDKSGEAILVGGYTKFNVYNPACWSETQASAAKEKGETMRRLGI